MATLLEGAGRAFTLCEVKDLLKFNKWGVKAVKLENNVSEVRISDPSGELCIKNECFNVERASK